MEWIFEEPKESGDYIVTIIVDGQPLVCGAYFMNDDGERKWCFVEQYLEVPVVAYAEMPMPAVAVVSTKTEWEGEE